MKKTKKQLIKESLDHYDRMIEWAEKQDSKDFISHRGMIEGTGQSWGAIYCSLCTEFAFSCNKCYFVKKHKSRCVSLGWVDMNKSKTWGEWLVHAKKMRKIIQGL
jgi:hypothetical protein